VWERQKSGSIHFHLVVVLEADIRTGTDFKAFEDRDYRSANAKLKAEWAFWRRTAGKYGFGRHELLPVKSTDEGIARYVGGYIKKGVASRRASDKGARIVRFLGFKPGDRRVSSRFAWNTPNAWLWRQKVKCFAKSWALESLDDLVRVFGRRWAYHLCDEILSVRIDVVYPSKRSAERGFELTMNHQNRVLVAREKSQSDQATRTVLLNPTICYPRQQMSCPLSGLQTLATL
jgi:hypothetical protein